MKITHPDWWRINENNVEKDHILFSKTAVILLQSHKKANFLYCSCFKIYDRPWDVHMSRPYILPSKYFKSRLAKNVLYSAFSTDLIQIMNKEETMCWTQCLKKPTWKEHLLIIHHMHLYCVFKSKPQSRNSAYLVSNFSESSVISENLCHHHYIMLLLRKPF